LVVTPEGLPLAYEVLPGNIADKATLRGFLEIDVRQLRQDVGIDFTRAKERLVLSEAETSEPTPDIHSRTPRTRTDHPSVEAPCPGPGS
jgi:hypothetical protein